MFTIEQIKAAHEKVKSGADFPKYIQDLIDLGVLGYDAFVTDGHIEYRGADHFKAVETNTYNTINIAPSANKERFIECLVMHQDGQTDYLTFCHHAAQCGIAKWYIDLKEMTCTYYDSAENPILIEKIPE